MTTADDSPVGSAPVNSYRSSWLTPELGNDLAPKLEESGVDRGGAAKPP